MEKLNDQIDSDLGTVAWDQRSAESMVSGAMTPIADRLESQALDLQRELKTQVEQRSKTNDQEKTSSEPNVESLDE